ncbi:MAG: hypothetical protein CM15mP83_9070 [Flavobacteriaceae bacterium]|nr:MAG: hypothetical protein CM15mP83_9070 [Flavobacteriaceae bacterium]
MFFLLFLTLYKGCDQGVPGPITSEKKSNL